MGTNDKDYLLQLYSFKENIDTSKKNLAKQFDALYNDMYIAVHVGT